MFARGTAADEVTGDWFPVNEGDWALCPICHINVSLEDKMSEDKWKYYLMDNWKEKRCIVEN